MARAKSGGQSISQIFRQYFLDHPEWLSGSNNAPVFEKFQEDHPSIAFNDSVKGVAANIKSKMRKESGTTPSGRGRKAKQIRQAVKEAPSSTNVLQGLEESIDTCLMTAKSIQSGDDLANVIKYLRRARNFVSLRLDELEGN